MCIYSMEIFQFIETMTLNYHSGMLKLQADFYSKDKEKDDKPKKDKKDKDKGRARTLARTSPKDKIDKPCYFLLAKHYKKLTVVGMEMIVGIVTMCSLRRSSNS